MNYVLLICKIFLSTPIFLIHVFLNIFFSIRIGKIDTSRIGIVYLAELYLIKKKIKKINQFEIWVTDKKISNIQMYKMLDRKFNILNFMRFYYDALNFWSIKINFFSKYITRLNFNKDYIYHNKLGTQMKLSKQEYNKAKNLAENFNIPKKSKIICINCRDSAYLKKSHLGSDFSYHDYRDTNINSFIPLIKKLIKKKYFVIRVGKISKRRVKIKSKYFLDYPFSKYKNDLLDFYFPKICSLWIGSNSGLDTLAFLFRKPAVVVNLAPLGVLLHNLKNKKLIYHFKSYVIKKTKKLSFSAIFRKNLNMLGSTKEFSDNNIKLKSATKREISEICWEGLNYFIKKKKFSNIDKDNQKILNLKINSLFKNNDKKINCILSPIFFKKNKWILDN